MGAERESTEHLYKRGRIWWCWYYDDSGAQVRRSTGATEKKAARARLQQWEHAAADPTAQDPPTLNDCLTALLTDRRRRTGAKNVDFLEDKMAPLVSVLGHERPITAFNDPRVSWEYIDARRRMATPTVSVSDRTIDRELLTLKAALAMAKSRRLWSGDLEVLIPPDFAPPPAEKGDTITRENALKVFPLLAPDTAAATAFALATGAELSALHNALRSDIPEDLTVSREILVRGTKNARRHGPVPVITDEQRLLLAYALKHAQGADGKLFGNLHRMLKDLNQACVKVGVTVVSPHDLRRSAGQWMVDLGLPIELVSKFMRHASTHITETIYAAIRQEDVADRMLDAIDPRYAQQALKGREKPVVPTLTVIPEPRQLAVLHEVDGVTKSLDAWADASGIPKGTLYYRVVTRGMSMPDALRKGTPGQRKRAPVADADQGG